MRFNDNHVLQQYIVFLKHESPSWPFVSTYFFVVEMAFSLVEHVALCFLPSTYISWSTMFEIAKQGERKGETKAVSSWAEKLQEKKKPWRKKRAKNTLKRDEVKKRSWSQVWKYCSRTFSVAPLQCDMQCTHTHYTMLLVLCTWYGKIVRSAYNVGALYERTIVSSLISSFKPVELSTPWI